MEKMKRNSVLFLLLGLGAATMQAQTSVSYNANSVPIGGNQNTAIGTNALPTTTGSSNSALGYEALKANTTGLGNTAVGWKALTANTNTVGNSGLGYQALTANVSGNFNTATGIAALAANSSGANNTAQGAGALYTNTTGSNNTAIGYYADVSANNLTNATAIGYDAKVTASNTIQLGNNAVTTVQVGTGNTAKLITGNLQVTGGSPAAGKVLTSDASGNATWQTPSTSGGSGWSLLGNAGTVSGTHFIGTTDAVPLSFRVNNVPSGRIDTYGYGNTYFGFRAGNFDVATGINNVAMGFAAMQLNTVGQDNVAIGSFALSYNQTGEANTAVGANALLLNSSGYENTALGIDVLTANIGGGGNTATGAYSLHMNSAGDNNVANGWKALHNNTTGSLNTATGWGSLLFSTTGYDNTAAGARALHNNQTGYRNTALGVNALMTNTTGNLNLGLGYQAEVSTNNLSNATAIGANSVVNASNKVRIGSPTVTVVEGSVAYTFISDGRFKNNVREEDVRGLDFITRLRPVVYNLDTRKLQGFLTQNMPDSIRAEYMKQDFETSTAIRQSGFIAQEVEAAAKASGYDFNGVHVPQDENDNYSLAYSQFVVPLVKGMQEQQTMIETQATMLAQQQARIENLEKQISALTAATSEKIAPTSAAIADPNPVSIYPNPNAGRFTINTQTLDQGHIEITNAAGQLIQTLELQPNTATYPVDLSQQPKGTYLIRVLTQDNTFSKKVILE